MSLCPHLLRTRQTYRERRAPSYAGPVDRGRAAPGATRRIANRALVDLPVRAQDGGCRAAAELWLETVWAAGWLVIWDSIDDGDG
jgi:hypothetical protein